MRSVKPSSPVRVAIVGAGLMGRWHAHAARCAGAHITAIVDPDRGRADRLSARHSGSRSFRELGQALELADVVHICTPTHTHVTLTEQALRGRRHVLIEKPLAPTVAETAELLRLAESHGVLLCPVHQFLFQDGVQTALSNRDAIGPLRHVDITICSAGAEGVDDMTRDRIAIDILPHPLSLLVRLLPNNLTELEWAVRHPAAGEIRAITQAGDVTVSLLVSMSGRPTVNRMQLTGEQGTVHVDLFHGFAVRQAGVTSRTRKVIQPFVSGGTLIAAASANLLRRSWKREPAYPGLRSLVERFYGAVSDGGPCPISPAEALGVAQIAERLGAGL